MARINIEASAALSEWIDISRGKRRLTNGWRSLTTGAVREISGHVDRFDALAVSSSAERLASGGADHSVVLWDVR